MADHDHSLVFTVEGREVEHPQQDIDGCDFGDYVDRDWAEPHLGLGTYLFTRVTVDGGPPYWNGTYLG